ncbi:MAG: hypothetical protein ACRDGR_03490 [bacterium]
MRPRDVARRWSRAAATSSLLLALLPSGCAVLFPDPPAEPPRGSLSDAAEEAAKPPAEQTPVEPAPGTNRGGSSTQTQSDDGADEIVVVPAQLDSGKPIATTSASLMDLTATLPAEDYERFQAGPVAGIGFEAGGVFERIDVFGLEFGFVADGRSRINIEGLYSKPRLDPARGLDASITNVEELAADFSGRFYLTPPHTFMGVYLGGGYRVGRMSWDWRNPIRVPNEAGGFDEFGNDAIVTHSFHVDLGMSPMQLAHFHVGGHLVYGLKLYTNTTTENFDNDLFQDVGFGQVLFDIVYVR